MSSSFLYYLFVLVGIVMAIVIVKKVTGCLFRLFSIAVIVAVLMFIYFTYFR
jgi:hypothetical protein